MSKKQKPEVITLPEGKLEELKSRLLTYAMPDDDKKILLTILTTYAWLTRQLRSTKLSIKRLKNLFGFTTEKHSRKKKEKDETLPVDPSGLPITTAANNTQEDNVVSIKKNPNGTLKRIMVD